MKSTKSNRQDSFNNNKRTKAVGTGLKATEVEADQTETTTETRETITTATDTTLTRAAATTTVTIEITGVMTEIETIGGMTMAVIVTGAIKNTETGIE